MATNFTTTGVHDGSERLTNAVWIHYSGTSNSIYADHGCSSITDDGVGQHTITMSPGLGTNAYAPVSDTEANSKSAINQYVDTLCDVLIRPDSGGSYVDSNHVQLICGGGGTS